MASVEAYVVSDYNPAYLNGSIETVVSRLISEISSENDFIEDFDLEVEDKVEGLSQNSAKVVMRLDAETSVDGVKMIEELNGSLRTKISSEAIYSVTAASSRSANKYAEQYK